MHLTVPPELPQPVPLTTTPPHTHVLLCRSLGQTQQACHTLAEHFSAHSAQPAGTLPAQGANIEGWVG